MSKWTEAEIKFLKENYPNKGAIYCATLLKKSPTSIRSKVGKLKLSTNGKKNHQINIEKEKQFNFNYWTNLNNPEICYLLGFFWADGSLSKWTKKFTFAIVEKDFKQIEYLFKKADGWKIKTHNYSEKDKPQTIAETRSFFYFNFLQDLNYDIKSGESACKILSKIPENLQHYWWRGFFDGDGSFYAGKCTSRFNLSACYDQNWNFATKLLNELGIKYKLSKTINKKGQKYSTIVCSNLKGVKIFGNYIYQDYAKDQIGLIRKREKFENILNFKHKLRSTNITGFRGVSYHAKSKKYRAAFHHKRKYFLGSFLTPEDAAKAYDKKAKEILGEFAVLNFPDLP